MDQTKVLEAARDSIRAALDAVGLTHDKVPVLAMMEDWDITLLSPLDLLDVCATAARAEDKKH